MNKTTVEHDPHCQLCAKLASGETVTRNGVEIPHLCPDCLLHHHNSYPCPAAAKMPKSRCPKCRKNTRALQDVPESARWERKVYALYCAPCLEDEGWVMRELEVVMGRQPYTATWWEKPSKRVDTMSTDELFDRVGSTVWARAHR